MLRSYFTICLLLMSNSNDRVRHEADAKEDSAESEWLLGFLRRGNPARWLTKQIQHFAPGGKHSHLYNGPLLGEHHTAGGLRKGASSLLLQKMPADIACAVTGHAPDERIRNISYYNDAFLVSCYPGARVLAGQTYPPWGHLCGPPPSPKLVPSPYPTDD